MSITALTTVTAATEYALTLDEAKAHLRITHNSEDAYIQSLIAEASNWAATYMRRRLVDTEVSLKFDSFPTSGRNFYIGFGATDRHFDRVNIANRKLNVYSRDMGIFLPGGVVTAVNQIAYTDADGNPQTLTGPTSSTPGTDYQEDLTDDEWPAIFPAANSDWPATDSGVINAVTITYQAGWSSGSDVPESIRHAMRLKIGDDFVMRNSLEGAKTPAQTAAENLLDPYVVTLV